MRHDPVMSPIAGKINLPMFYVWRVFEIDDFANE